MKQFFINMVSSDSTISHKRVIGIAAFVLLGIAFLLDLGFDIKVSENLLKVMEFIVMACFGSTVVEKFASTNQKA